RPYDDKVYFKGFDRKKKTVLIISKLDQENLINPYFLSVVEQLLSKGYQIVWETGKDDYKSIKHKFCNTGSIFICKNIKDIYPYYAASRLVICRAETNILSEIAYFGLPCVIIPRTTKKDNSLWLNAGVVEMQGWGIRLVQDETLPGLLLKTAENILEDDALFEKMCRKALDHAPLNAASRISKTIYEDVLSRN
ncbi:MAG: glycosyltransferase, partial [Fibrobacter sp.]|nr:glycosyltransferase [Fibrobacter sp.]